jgi:hypothetical protein
MQDLTNDAQTGKKAYLVPSSMSEGGEVHFDPGNVQMTAPGSQPVSAPAPQWPGQAPETLPLPVDSLGTDPIPVSFPGDRERVTAQSANAGNGRFGLTPAGRTWTKAGE